MTQQQRWRRAILLLASLIASLLFAAVLFRVTAYFMGIHDPAIRYELRLGMWQPDQTTGYANRPNFMSHCWGDVVAATNEQGLRGRRPIAMDKGSTFRIIGIGDSVTWGTGVNEDASFLGALHGLLNAAGTEAEVINAGVVGYSTYQEYLYLRDKILDLNPDLVLVNFCVNDFLPTADPFGNMRTIYRRYIEDVMGNSNLRLAQDERDALIWIIRMLESAESVWREVDPMRTPARVRKAILKVLIEQPFRMMNDLCRNRGIRFVVLLIPTRQPDPAESMVYDDLWSYLQTQGIESLDLRPDLTGAPAPDRTSPSAAAKATDWLLKTWLLRHLRAILAVQHLKEVHEREDFIDEWHPSRKGNRIIANRVFEKLAAAGSPAPNKACRLAIPPTPR